MQIHATVTFGEITAGTRLRPPQASSLHRHLAAAARRALTEANPGRPVAGLDTHVEVTGWVAGADDYRSP